MTDFDIDTFPLAFKKYRCAWCGETIPIGEQHVKHAGKWNGEFQNWRMHRECYTDASDSGEMKDGFSLYEHERP